MLLALIINISVLSVRGENAMSLPQTIRLINAVKQKIRRETGIKLRIQRIKRRYNPYSDFLTIDTRDLNIEWFYELQEYKRGKGLGVAILPPLKQYGKYWLAGAANICDPNGDAWANAEMRDNEGIPRWRLSVITLTHELGHLLGSSHDPHGSSFVMSPYTIDASVMRYFSEQSKQQIRECV